MTYERDIQWVIYSLIIVRENSRMGGIGWVTCFDTNCDMIYVYSLCTKRVLFPRAFYAFIIMLIM